MAAWRVGLGGYLAGGQGSKGTTVSCLAAPPSVAQAWEKIAGSIVVEVAEIKRHFKWQCFGGVSGRACAVEASPCWGLRK